MLERRKAEDGPSFEAFLKWALSSPRGPADPTLGVSFEWEKRVADFDPPTDSSAMLYHLAQLEAERMLMKSMSTTVPTLTPRELFALVDFVRDTPPPAKRADLSKLTLGEVEQLEVLLAKAKS